MFDFKNKKVLITGHTGFKGTWLTLWLSSLGAEIIGFSLPDQTEERSHFNELNLSKKIVDIRGDIRNYTFIKDTIEKYKPDYIFHLAAQALVRHSYDNPVETFETNAIGTLNILESVRGSKDVKVVVCITSDKCYRNDEQIWGYKETDHLGGHDPYSASKSCAEIIAQSYFKSFLNESGPFCATVRAGNVIGGGDWSKDRIIPDCEKAWVNNLPVYIRSPYATRPWQLVLEPLSGYMQLANELYKRKITSDLSGYNPVGESFNFGPSASVCCSVKDVITHLQNYWDGLQVTIDSNTIDNKKECNLLKLCCDKALAYFGWEANLTFDETIEFTASWYKQFELECKGNSEKVEELSLKQINKYVQFATQRNRSWV